MNDDVGRFVRLSWALIEYKVMYYRPDLVHASRHEGLTVPDVVYDRLETRYLALCRVLGRPNTVVHKVPLGFDDVDSDGAMMEIDENRPSVQLVISKLKTRQKEPDL